MTAMEHSNIITQHFLPPILQATLAQQHAMCTVGPSLPNANPEDTESIKPMTFTMSVDADNVSLAKSLKDPAISSLLLCTKCAKLYGSFGGF